MVVSFFLTHLLLEVISSIIFLPSPFHYHDLQEVKDSIDEEDPSSTWSYAKVMEIKTRKKRKRKKKGRNKLR